ncbi:putative disease resistance RPP8-like protein 4 [Tasmannia lanceolata]|uniref:putative disease resistance RPP8-like protein 4 n=1 Tax=Tasmannia lanceolata TaxID=3420 RepID=UPI004064A5EF
MMAEALLNFFIQRLNFLLLEEGEIISDMRDQINQLKQKLEEILCFLGNAEKSKELPDWVHQLRNIVHDADDCIDKFIIQKYSLDGHDTSLLNAPFVTELENIEARLVEILGKKSLPDTTDTGKKEDKSRGEDGCFYFMMNYINFLYYLKYCFMYCCILDRKSLPNTTTSDADGGEEGCSSFMLNYRKLPYYLKSCLMYCCIFPEYYWIPKGRLVRLLAAEGLIHEREGSVVETVAEEYIEKLISMGMLQLDEKNLYTRTKFKVTNQYRELCLRMTEEENFITACVSYDTQIPHNAHRVSIHGNSKNLPPNLNNLPIRSLFVFGINGLSGDSWSCLKSVFYGVKLLRVLDLEEIKINSLPSEVGDLIHLRYLGLKKSDLNELPESLGNLRNLETLDIRWCGKLTVLSINVLNLIRLRHLKMFKNFSVSGMRLPAGIMRLTNLQTLTGLYAGGGIAKELSSLTQLRRLGVMDVSEDHASELYASIKNMGGLISLSLEGEKRFRTESTLHVDEFSPPPLLRKLRLEGKLERMPNWFISMENLTKLRLGFSHLSENPGSVLQLLSNLKILCLWHAHDAKQIGREFCSAGGFPNLEDLSIASHVLEEWTEVEEGAMPRLKRLHLHNCLKLRLLPEGLQYVTTLRQLDLLPLLDDHEYRLRPDGGEDNYKIRHIAHISYITTGMLENLRASRKT